MEKKARTYSGTTTPEVSQRELHGRAVARRAAADGMVLLKNEGLLPLQPGTKMALFGGGAVRTIKGGTGSGDVNEREVVSLYQGLKEAGFVFTNEAWLANFDTTYQNAREAWRDEILTGFHSDGAQSFLAYYSANIFRMPAGDPMKAEDFDGAAVGCYVISRTAGEDADRYTEPGDYELTDAEKQQLLFLSAHCENVMVVINTGGQIDLKFVEALPNLKALMVVSQPGMEGGHAFADVVTGKVTPSGKLTDTWTFDYEDFPNSATFSHNNGDVRKERYGEGQYVGYRYFDSFDKPVAYPFGFGLSYTDFSLKTESVTVDGNDVTVAVTVTNTGRRYSGREVVQIYLSCPQTELSKVHRKLAAFSKTDCLAPGESETVSVTFGAKDAASFDEKRCAWLVEAGRYAVWVGNSSRSLALAAVLQAERTTVVEEDKPICLPQEDVGEISCPIRKELEQKWHLQAERESTPVLRYAPTPEKKQEPPHNAAETSARELTDRLTEDQLIAMVIGEISKGQGSELGSAGIMVPGAAGETSSSLEEPYGIPGVSMADGPAGLRLVKSYEVERETGAIINQGMLGALEGGFFADHTNHENADRYYQYATAVPVGTMLAQSWDVALLAEVGKMIAGEMQEFGIGWWLAPGMNIHRNPLCGRNYEYYSEDPLLSGKIAAAITRGVQSVPGVGTTIKHFACNNQEDNRYGSDSILSQRVLREIYLRGFEIAVREAQPMCIMTSYNLINGVHTANSRDLCTEAARNEWGFRGIIMTDWTTTFPSGGSIAWKCIEAGNDLIMPGCQGDIDSIREALANGELKTEDLKACVRRLLTVIYQTLVFENPLPYGKQFEPVNEQSKGSSD